MMAHKSDFTADRGETSKKPDVMNYGKSQLVRLFEPHQVDTAAGISEIRAYLDGLPDSSLSATESAFGRPTESGAMIAPSKQCIVPSRRRGLTCGDRISVKRLQLRAAFSQKIPGFREICAFYPVSTLI
jgi:hypothetical protein